MGKYHKIMEYFWLTTAIAASIYVAMVINRTSFEESGVFLFMPVMAAAMFAVRRFMRKKAEQNSK